MKHNFRDVDSCHNCKHSRYEYDGINEEFHCVKNDVELDIEKKTVCDLYTEDDEE